VTYAFFCERFSEDESGEQVQITHETFCDVIESQPIAATEGTRFSGKRDLG
jgi:hypothetical protein